VTHSRRDILELLEANGLRPSRALGQNFVADANTVRRIARLAGVAPGDKVMEIGAGLGSLTMALAETGASVVAVETDRRLLPLLHAAVDALGVRVVHGDAMHLDLAGLLEEQDRADATAPASPVGWSMVANLPYNVAVPLVMRVLDDVPSVKALLVMVQREVGERLAAAPGSRAYGAVSVKVAYHAVSRVVGKVPATVFVPRPRVESVLVLLERRPVVAVDPALVPADKLFAVVRAGFAQRRKMLRRSLAGTVSQQAFDDAGIDASARAEELSIEQWGRLAACC